MSQPTDLLFIPEVAKIIRKSEDTLRYLNREGTGPRFGKLGRRVVYRRGDVEAWIEAAFA
jgi:predicted DNA-binding transcriptional regulator AlpA